MLKLALFGDAIANSLSPSLHQAFAKQAGILVDYQKITVPTGHFTEAVDAFIKSGGHGFNITSPFKPEAFQLSTHNSQAASLAKAVNTMVIDAHKQCYGDNTDGLGFVRDVTLNQAFSLHHKTIVIHGAGGAVRGLLPALFAEKPKKIVLIHRTWAKALALAEEFGYLGVIEAVAYGASVSAVDLLVDASSAACDNFVGLEALVFDKLALAYDLKYADKPTLFMVWAKARAVQHVSDGFGMLVEQAALSFQCWTGFSPATQGLISLARSL